MRPISTTFRKVIGVLLFVILGLLPATVHAKEVMTATSYNDLRSKIADAVIEGKTEFTINYKSMDSSPSGDISKLFSWGGINLIKNKEIDVAFYNITSVELQWASVDESPGYFLIKLQINTKMDSSEMQYVNEYISNLLSAVDFTDYSTYEKYAWIYDYITSNFSYDYSLESNDAYSALQEGKTTCGGFASLYYLMARNLGLPCKIAYGKAGETQHAWNLVKLNKKWYYVDTTWGSYYQNRKYFLKAQSKVTTHVLDKSYKELALEFSKTDYKVKKAVIKKA